MCADKLRLVEISHVFNHVRFQSKSSWQQRGDNVSCIAFFGVIWYSPLLGMLPSFESKRCVPVYDLNCIVCLNDI